MKSYLFGLILAISASAGASGVPPSDSGYQTPEYLVDARVHPVVLEVCKGERPISRDQWTDEAKVWLARSCVGEAGFTAFEECLGIAWVYAARSSRTGASLAAVIRAYSAAVKRRSTHQRPWILGLRSDGRRPEGWPSHLRWAPHRELWFKTLLLLDDWAEGKFANPVSGADHYGGSMDTPGKYWRRVEPKSPIVFRNRFYSSVYY